MVEIPNPDKDLRFGSVSLHSGGKAFHGTLHLTRHHLRFSYYPHAQKSDDSKSHDSATRISGTQSRSSISAESSTLSGTATPPVSTQTQGHAHGSKASSVINEPLQGHASPSLDSGKTGSRDHARKDRPKDVWIPYPVIYHCVLRPSHAPGPAIRPRDEDGRPVDEEDELFPPIFGTASYERPSSDSARLAPQSTTPRPTSPVNATSNTTVPNDSARQPAIRIRCRDFKMMAFHFHASRSGASPDEIARQAFYVLRNRRCIDRVEEVHAFHFHPPDEEAKTSGIEYDARLEFARMGISEKSADGPGAAWRISDINREYSYSATYPSVLCVPRTVSDNMLKYGAAFRSKCRIPCLSYLHSNGGSITRSSQPLVGVQGKRNPQDERLVSAIFSSHSSPLQANDGSLAQLLSMNSPSTSTLDFTGSDPMTANLDVPGLPASNGDTEVTENGGEATTTPRKKVYGSTRRNLIVDARPKMNVLANTTTGGGVENVANYSGSGDTPVEKVFLNIANIHVMRDSLDRVVESFANSDYIKVRPHEEILRKSGWLGHIAGLMDGAERVARVIGLGGSHVLVHCSDGWDRTAQVAALAQVMLDPHYRTLDGFISLIQKDFLSFGHKCKDRTGVLGSEKWFEIENERIAPYGSRENDNSDPGTLNTIGAKALSGAKNWFEKNRNSLFRQQNNSRDNVAEQSPSRSSSPPPNPIIHSPPGSTKKEKKVQKTSEHEISPVFHQFLETVYQLQYHFPESFEFNERFLRRLFYHAYSCQYGEFLFNSERERNLYRTKVPSVWPHFLSRRQEFTNPDYVAKIDDPLLFPKRQERSHDISVRWWNTLFLREDEEMNRPRALAPADPAVINGPPGMLISSSEAVNSVEKSESSDSGNDNVAKSAVSLTSQGDSVAASFSSLGIQSNDDTKEVAVTDQVLPQPNTDFEIVRKPEESAQISDVKQEVVVTENGLQVEPVAVEYDGDPLGVMASMSRKPERAGFDFAAFASQNAFRDR